MGLGPRLFFEGGFDLLVFLHRRKRHKGLNVAASAEIQSVFADYTVASPIALDGGATAGAHPHRGQRRHFPPGALRRFGFDGAADNRAGQQRLCQGKTVCYTAR